MTGDLDETAIKIAQALSLRAINGAGRTTYPHLAHEIAWHNPSGWHLGAPLKRVLEFCRDNNLPVLTSIVCNTGTDSPSNEGLALMRQVYGNFDLKEEQRKTLEFNWRTVPEFGLDMRSTAPGFDRMYATRVYGFEPQEWGMLGFGKEGFRASALELAGHKPFYVLHFCSQVDKNDKQGNPAIALSLKGRVLGIAEIQPILATPETHIEPTHRQKSIAQWGGDKWPFGLEMSRAWRFLPPPFTKDVLPVTSKDAWGPTNSIVEIADEERAAIAQCEMEEIPVFGGQTEVVQTKLRDASNYTYLMVCESWDALQHTSAPHGTALVKIGVTSDPERRLLEIKGNHVAVIFGLDFRKYATKLWSNQTRALEVECIAHDWAHKNSIHASGEYFFMTKEQYETAGRIVILGKV